MSDTASEAPSTPDQGSQESSAPPDPMALDPLSPLDPPADPWFHRFDQLGDSCA